jgi:hypothetical protein
VDREFNRRHDKAIVVRVMVGSPIEMCSRKFSYLAFADLAASR